MRKMTHKSEQPTSTHRVITRKWRLVGGRRESERLLTFRAVQTQLGRFVEFNTRPEQLLERRTNVDWRKKVGAGERQTVLQNLKRVGKGADSAQNEDNSEMCVCVCVCVRVDTKNVALRTKSCRYKYICSLLYTRICIYMLKCRCCSVGVAFSFLFRRR